MTRGELPPCIGFDGVPRVCHSLRSEHGGLIGVRVHCAQKPDQCLDPETCLQVPGLPMLSALSRDARRDARSRNARAFEAHENVHVKVASPTCTCVLEYV